MIFLRQILSYFGPKIWENFREMFFLLVQIYFPKFLEINCQIFDDIMQVCQVNEKQLFNFEIFISTSRIFPNIRKDD